MRLSLFDPKPPPALDTGPRSIGAVKMLRISLTDRCNFRCVYCMPAEGVAWLAKDELLSFEEIADIVRAAIDIHGIRRFKLTGGEPTVRRGLTELVRTLRDIPGVEDLSLTTNGHNLADLARPLLESGLHRVTISADSLRADRFKTITRTGDLAAVMRGIDASLAAGFASVKINCVMMRGTNDDELADFARLTLDRRLSVRFIEYMPLGDSAVMGGAVMGGAVGGRVADDEVGPSGGCGAQDRGDVFISETEARALIEAELGPLTPVDRATEAGVGPAVPYRLPNAVGRVGFISAMSAPFCSTCNRLRLTATGVLRSCLFEGGEVDLKPVLRGTPADRRQAIADAMTDCVRLKPDVHSFRGNEQMSRIGG
ncbi:MAG TPA: GTP 3',8-cyclase MoaA [Tepidisphaeraceae bacterium]|jgi:cyclic pyranopterin phosphate synthase